MQTTNNAIEASAASGAPVKLKHGKDGLYWALCDQLARVALQDTQFDDVSRFWGELDGRKWNVVVSAH